MIAKAVEKGVSFGAVSVEACVGAAMRDLSHEIRTYGPALHEFFGGTFGPMFKYI